MNKKDKKRTFKVDFFKICELRDDEQSVYSIPMNIEAVLLRLEKERIQKRIMTIEEEKVRLQNINKISLDKINEYGNIKDNENLWELKFIKIKDSEVFGIANENGDYNEDDIEEILLSSENNKKFLASATPCIIDTKNNIIIIPRNKEAVLIGEILDFFRRICNKKDLEFCTISRSSKIDFTSNINFRSVEISLKNIDFIEKHIEKEISEKARTIFEVITSFRKMKSRNMSMKGTMGNDKKGNLTKEIGMEILELARTECKNIGILKLGISKIEGNTSGNIEHIDLLGDKLNDKFSIKYNSEKRIKSNDLIEKTIESYDKNYRYI
ncbi:Uncharacterised protein [[Clostridium] sordellii]|uniref:DUF6731 family protein n=1 Tax=Paraclostridium sordellii TaxID=1505 RepID=UPI0005EA4D2D|nr:DUF6731 family protein [Paeniclostridium sordellii]CEQ10650.1 Uncharacterised protein [[Clostridium] sordellii] [Paeniclostridium sordellii]